MSILALSCGEMSGEHSDEGESSVPQAVTLRSMSGNVPTKAVFLIRPFSRALRLLTCFAHQLPQPDQVEELREAKATPESLEED